MGNFPRYIPANSLVEVTTRTMQGRLLLVPSRDLNDIVCGILARALARYDVELVDFKVLSNRVHILAVVAHAKALADFMCGLETPEPTNLTRWPAEVRPEARSFESLFLSHLLEWLHRSRILGLKATRGPFDASEIHVVRRLGGDTLRRRSAGRL